MNKKCLYFKVVDLTVNVEGSKNKFESVLSGKRTVEYCDHDQSVVTINDAMSVIGPGKMLHCEGRVSDCMLPEELKKAVQASMQSDE